MWDGIGPAIGGFAVTAGMLLLSPNPSPAGQAGGPLAARRLGADVTLVERYGRRARHQPR